MKKILAMAVALIAAVTVNAQDLTDNYQKIYAGWHNFKAFDAPSEVEAMNGFNIGYAYAFNITGHNAPLFLEVGAEYGFLKDSESKINTLSIPLNVAYKFGNESFAVVPYIGESLRTYLSATVDGNSLYDGDNAPNRVQAVFNAGVNFVISSHFTIGYRFQASETTFASKVEIKNASGDVVASNDPKNDYTNCITVGYTF